MEDVDAFRNCVDAEERRSDGQIGPVDAFMEDVDAFGNHVDVMAEDVGAFGNRVDAMVEGVDALSITMDTSDRSPAIARAE